MSNYYGSKSVYSVEQLKGDIYKYQNTKFGAFPQNLAIGWMDFYVANERPETIEKWVDDCLAIPKVQKTGKDGTQKDVIDKKAIRKKFLETYFPDYTDEKVAERKKKAEKNPVKKTEREKLVEKLKKLSR